MEFRTPNAHVVVFGVFELDRDSGELRRHGLKIRLPDQPFQILNTLLNRPGEIVTRDELRHVLWTPETFVDFEVGLNSAVRKLREALDDSAENPRFVETLPRRGYRFVAPVTVLEAAPAPAFEPAIEQSSGRASVPGTGQRSVAAAGQAGRAEFEPSADPGLRSPSEAAASVPPAGELVPVTTALRRSSIAASRAVGVLLLVIGLAGTGGAIYQRSGVAALLVGPPAPIRSVLVLPFENLTGDQAQDYLVDSITDALTVHLGQVPGLDVVSRTTALQYRDTAKRLPEIGRELPVEGVVSGTVVRTGTGIRITAQLSRAATDRVEWGDSYDGDLGRLLNLQPRIASDIAGAAGLPAAVAGRSPQDVDPRAYDAYIKGLTAKGQQRYEGIARAVGYFEDAIAIQPDFAEAYAELATMQVQFLYTGPFAPHEAMPKAEAAARKALQLDPNLAEAHRSLGQVLSLYHWRWDEGEKAMARALELKGSRNDFSAALTGSLLRRGLYAEAVATAEARRKLDPLSVNAQVALGFAYCAAGQYDRALSELRRALEMSPGNNRVNFHLGITFVAMGRLDDGIRALELAARPAHGHNSRIEAYLGYAYAAAGRTRDARAVLQELEAHRRDQYVSWFGIALIHDALGEKSPALAALQRAAQERAVEFGQLAQYPPFRAIAAEPGFHSIMQQIGLPY